METATRAKKKAKEIIRRLIPAKRAERSRHLSTVRPASWQKYLQLRALDMAGFKSQNAHRVPVDAKSVVFVCFGNIMRSAMAEFLLLRALKETGRSDIRAMSAGLHAGNGTEAHPWAQLAATTAGISLSGHRAKLLTREMVDQCDAILAMDFQNKSELLAQYPDAAIGFSC